MKKLYLYILLTFVLSIASAQYTWINKSLFPDSGRGNASCGTINGKGYVIGGIISLAPVTYTNQTWEYDPIADSWTRKADLPSTASGGMFFSINNKGYVVGGVNNFNGNYSSAMYEYDPTANTWTPKASFPEDGLGGSYDFVINGIAYIGAGIRNSNVHGVISGYAYNPVNDSWNPIANYPGNPSIGLASFAIDSFGYAGGGGTGNGQFYNDFYKYDPRNDAWTTISSFPGKGRFVIGSSSFILNGLGFVGGGFTSFNGSSANYYDLGDYYQYDRVADKWALVSGLPGAPRSDNAGFSIDNIGYSMGGIQHDGNILSRLVSEFTLCGAVVDTAHVTINDTTHVSDTSYVSIATTDTLYIKATLTGIAPPNNVNTLEVFPNPAKDHIYINTGNYANMSGYIIKISNSIGQDVFSSPVNQQQFYINLNGWTGPGIYVLYLVNPQLQVVDTKMIVLQ